MFNKLKTQRGITGIDITISIIIIMLFISIIATLSINISTSVASKERMNLATECISKIMEELDRLEYDNIEIISNFETIKTNVGYSSNTLKQAVKEILLEEDAGYDVLDVSIKTENWYAEGKTTDLLKKLTVKVTYKLNQKDQTIEVSRLKPKFTIDLENAGT